MANNKVYNKATDFTSGVRADLLVTEIQASAITVALDLVTITGNSVDIIFKDPLSAANETILDGLVAAHDGTTPVQNLLKLDEPRTPDGFISVGPAPLQTSHQFEAKGLSFVAAAGVATSQDLKITHPNGILLVRGQFVVEGTPALGDYVTFQVVDVDNILGYGAGAVLKTYIDTFYLCPSDAGRRIKIEPGTVADLLADLYMRVTYHSTGASPLDVLVVYEFLKK